MRYGRRYGYRRYRKMKLAWEPLFRLESERDQEEERNGSEDKQKGLRKGAKKP
jgi:hypothetical protein